MKKAIFTLIICLIFAFGYGQQTIPMVDPQAAVWLFGVTKYTAQSYCDSILKMTNNKYVFEYEKPATKNGEEQSFVYNNVKNDRIIFTFEVFNILGNSGSEQKETPMYYLKSIECLPLLEIFPFWKILHPEADIEKLSTTDYYGNILLVSNGPNSKLYLSEQSTGCWKLWKVIEK